MSVCQGNIKKEKQVYLSNLNKLCDSAPLQVVICTISNLGRRSHTLEDSPKPFDDIIGTLALTEGRGDARCEVGLASIDLSLPTIILCQISDSQSYINTLTKINILNPTDIIVPSTFLECNNRLVESIKRQFPNIKILGIPRKNFNKNNGMEQILQVCLPSINTICVGLQHKYYALSSASALVVYLHNHLNIYYPKESLNVSYQESEGYAIIDFSTADRLELVSCTKPVQATRYSTLFGVLNHCVTKVGARLLRSTILQPPSSPLIIENTLYCVSELLKHPQIHVSIQTILHKISNIDQLLTLASMPTATNESSSARQLNYLLLLNSLIDLIEPLKEVIEPCQQPFFKELKQTLESDNFTIIADLIRTMIQPSAQFAKSEAGAMQRCYAIKPGINGLLDLVRKTYSERLNDLGEYVKFLGGKYSLPLTLGNNNTKGYHIVLKLNSQQKRTWKKSDLPPEFIQVYRLAGSFTMKTHELINYSTRLDDIMLEVMKISNLMIRNIIVNLKQYLGFFYKLCEDIARLDFLQSLTEASRRRHYTRPKFGDFTELTNARHPMLDLLVGEQNVANPISICKDFNVQIITGPNGSGKSIYIRQVMLLQIMAQIGCYVPADFAIFRPMSRMFARIYLDDDMEYRASSFILEIKEVKYMMSILNDNSLFIIDELCRSTAADEGAALAMAICEKFCTASAFVYVTTHYISLSDLRELYLNVKTWQMETIATGDTPQELNLDFRFKLIPGITNLKHYGVYIVKNIWPERILEEVYAILNEVKKNPEKQKYVGVNEPIRLEYKLVSDLNKMKSLGKLTNANVNKLLNDYQIELQKLDVFFDLLEECEIEQNEADDASVKDVWETSSYQNLSDFIREDSDNINKLIPEVSIAYSDRELVLQEDSEVEEDMTLEKDNLNGTVVDLQEANQSREESQGCSGITFLSLGSNMNDLSQAEKEIIERELEEASRSLLEDDDFDFSQASSYRTAVEEMNPEVDKNQGHISPIVKVVEGAAWSPDSSFSNAINAQDAESISYSPLHLEFSFAEIQNEINEDFSKQESTFDRIDENYAQVESKSSVFSKPLSSSLGPKFSFSERIISSEPNNSFKTEFSFNRTNRNSIFDHTKTYEDSFSFTKMDDNVTSDQTVVNKESKTSSSSLHFIAKDNGGSNLADISTIRDIDNITIENIKSNSEKPSGDQSDSKKTSSSSVKESDESPKKIMQIRRHPFKKFTMPKKLTRREIQEEFDEQDRKLYESSASESQFSKYLSHVFNRPSVRQVQNSKHLAFVRKTEEGVEVIPVEPKPKKNIVPFQRNLSNNSNIDMSIFSDKNAKRFDEFLNSDERDVKRFKFSFGSQKESQGFHFQPQSISEYAAAAETAPFFFQSQGERSEKLHSLSPVNPGEFKQNEEDIDNIINKYLRAEKTSSETSFENSTSSGQM